MHSVRQILNAGSCLFALTLCTGACDVADLGDMVDDGSLVIVFASPMDDDCSVSTQSGDDYVYLPWGTLDIYHPNFAGKPSYLLHLQVHNYIRHGGEFPIHIEKATVSYEWLSGRENIQGIDFLEPLLAVEEYEHQSFLSASLGQAGESGEPARLVMPVVIVPPSVGELLFALSNIGRLPQFVLGVHVRFEGKTHIGGKVVSNDFVFPLTFCVGCLSQVCDTYYNELAFPACLPGQDSPTWECEY